MEQVGDPERDRAVDALRGAYVCGRLSAGDLEQRMAQALAARSAGELQASLAGIPGPIESGAPVASPRVESELERDGDAVQQAVAIAFRWLAVTIWLAAVVALFVALALVAASFLLVRFVLSDERRREEQATLTDLAQAIHSFVQQGPGAWERGH